MKKNEELKSKWPFEDKFIWQERALIIAKLIPREASILDLGGGWGYLHELLPNNRYQSLDQEPWTNLTTKADFNKSEFPNVGVFDIIVCAGILEYIDELEKFLKAIQKYGKSLIISYQGAEEIAGSRKNLMAFKKFDSLLQATGWPKVSERITSPEFMKYDNETEKIFYCKLT